LPEEMIAEIGKTIQKSNLGYKSKSEFVKEAVRNSLKELAKYDETKQERKLYIERIPQETRGGQMPEEPTLYNAPDRPAETNAATNVLELLDRILDKGLVIVGDIRVSVADIELLKIQIRLLIASVDKAKELGIDFSWAKEIETTKSKGELEAKIQMLEEQLHGQQRTGTEQQTNEPTSALQQEPTKAPNTSSINESENPSNPPDPTKSI
jgi:Arc/MetJ-type ribon-helix-helix transcriptional regulator